MDTSLSTARAVAQLDFPGTPRVIAAYEKAMSRNGGLKTLSEPEKEVLLWFLDKCLGAVCEPWRKTSTKQGTDYSSLITTQDEALALQIMTFYHHDEAQVDEDYTRIREEFKYRDVAKELAESNSSGRAGSSVSSDSQDQDRPEEKISKKRVSGKGVEMAITYYNKKVKQLNAFKLGEGKKIKRSSLDEWIKDNYNRTRPVERLTVCATSNSRANLFPDLPAF